MVGTIRWSGGGLLPHLPRVEELYEPLRHSVRESLHGHRSERTSRILGHRGQLNPYRIVLPGTGKRMMRARDEDGFTLVELLVAMAITAIVFGATLTVLDVFQSNNRFDQLRNENQDNARTAIDR